MKQDLWKKQAIPATENLINKRKISLLAFFSKRFRLK